MQIKNKLKSPAVLGTLLLASSGILGKIIGFFYKIFLSRTIGAEGLGIYQLIFPLSAICFAVTSAGLSTALSKFVAEYRQKDPSSPRRFLAACLLASSLLSLAALLLLRRFSSFIAGSLLLEPRCEPLIDILAWSVPLASIHSCIHGYYYGKKRALVPALSSLIEQLVRVFFVFFACRVQLERGGSINVSAAVWGLAAGEAGAFLFCVTALLLEREGDGTSRISRFGHAQDNSSHMSRPGCSQNSGSHMSRPGCSRNSGPHISRPGCSQDSGSHMSRPGCSQDNSSHMSRPGCSRNSGSCISHPGWKLLSYSIPLSANRLALTLFSSFESILIPSRLRLYGYSQSDALSIYGVLTGMALSVVMCPTVLTNSVSVMILPVISEAASRKDSGKINLVIRQTILACLFSGSLCTVGLLLAGGWIGDTLFCNSLAGRFIRMLSFLCPFLFLSSILSSVLHGLGMPGCPFLLNLTGSLVRILFVYLLVPFYGIRACLAGMLASQMLTAGLSVWILWKKRLRAS